MLRPTRAIHSDRWRVACIAAFFGMDGESNGSSDEIVANGNLVAEVSQSRISDVD
jgi:hypothetical protein